MNPCQVDSGSGLYSCCVAPHAGAWGPGSKSLSFVGKGTLLKVIFFKKSAVSLPSKTGVGAIGRAIIQLLFSLVSFHPQ